MNDQKDSGGCGMRNEAGLVSCITPVYNGEKYLGAMLDSLLAQTYPAMESGRRISSLSGQMRNSPRTSPRPRLIAAEAFLWEPRTT